MDLAIRGAVIVDGTGAPRFGGDIGVKDGRIVAIGADVARADEEIDAKGAVVAPGFIDCHTHYDAQICWDNMLSPELPCRVPRGHAHWYCVGAKGGDRPNPAKSCKCSHYRYIGHLTIQEQTHACRCPDRAQERSAHQIP